MNCTKDKESHGVSNAWSAANRQKKMYGFDTELDGNHGSAGYDKQVCVGMVMC